jgi:hypothetical protein
VRNRERIACVAAAVVAAAVLSACGSASQSTSTTTTTVPTGLFVPTSASIVNQLVDVPISVFNSVGIVSPKVAVTAMDKVLGAPPLNWKLDGVAKPTIYYYGAEFCPFCAAERWPLIIALSRFGTFTKLGDTQSSSIDEFPNTQSFTLWKATYTSAYVNFFSTESYSNVPTPTYYERLQAPTAQETNEVSTFDSPNYISGVPQGGSIPFVSFNNHFFIVGSSYDPSALAGLTRSQIASKLTDTSDHATQAIIATANLISASVCNIDAQQPSSVCQSSGVRAADQVMGIKP